MSSPLTSSPTPLFCPLPATPTTRITHGPKVRSSSSHFPSPALPLHSHHRTLSKSISQIWPTVFLQSDWEYFSPHPISISLFWRGSHTTQKPVPCWSNFILIPTRDHPQSLYYSFLRPGWIGYTTPHFPEGSISVGFLISSFHISPPSHRRLGWGT